jgi:hypothetical protein
MFILFYIGCFWEEGNCYPKKSDCGDYKNNIEEKPCNSKNNKIPGGIYKCYYL